MNNKDGLQKLIPMSDDELENTSTGSENINSIAPVLTDVSIQPGSPSKTRYDDFSLNSFVVIETPSRIEVTRGEDSCSVYMESILGLMKSLNTRVDALSTARSLEKATLERVSACLGIHDIKSAKECLDTLQITPQECTVYHTMVYRTLPSFLVGLRQHLVDVTENLLAYRNCYTEIENKLCRRAEENERLKGIINQQAKDHIIQIDALSLQNTNMKDGMLALCKEYGSGVESQLEVDIMKEVAILMKQQSESVNSLKEEIQKKDMIIEQFERKANMFEVRQLSTQIETLQKTQHTLQSENLNLTQIVSKLSEKNNKLKQELLFFNTEMKKAMETIGRKNETISRQKSLIELFQEKISGSTFPVEDLRRKKKEIEERLALETDYFTKQTLRREKEDCTKRLSDFMNLQPGSKK